MENFSTRVLSQYVIPERRQPELALFTPTALCFVKNAPGCDAIQTDWFFVRRSCHNACAAALERYRIAGCESVVM